MGIFNFLFGRPRNDIARPLRIEGDGTFEFEIVGESYYQDAIAAAAGHKIEDGYELEVEAVLAPENDNKFDSNAVGVWIQNRKVGHLSKAAAKVYRNNFGTQHAECDALIAGGWRRTRRDGTIDEGHFGVRLDIADDRNGRFIRQ